MVILGPGASPAGHRNNGVAKGYEVSMAEQVVGQASTEVSMGEDVNVGKLSFPAMLSLVVGSMIGGGIFSLPQNIAAAASPGPMVIGWTITGIGMICLAMVYQKLAIRRPDLDNGIYVAPSPFETWFVSDALNDADFELIEAALKPAAQAAAAARPAN